MAKMIDQKPTYHGEARLWEAINAYLPDNVIVYNGREINGREFDFCLFIENVGVLIIEVKGWLSDKIEVKGVDNIIVDGYDKPQRSPKKQARAYRFEMLNRIRHKYNVSPLVFDMVCYPFISRAEYLTTRLDTVSEGQFTIFKEDLESADQLIDKIQQAYNASNWVSHSMFSVELMVKMRQEWEPEDIDHIIHADVIVYPYSVLSVYPDEMNYASIAQIVEDYFHGVKRILFVGTRTTYTSVLDTLDGALKQHNIQAGGNKLNLGYKNGVHRGDNSTRIFNFELYFVDQLDKIVSTPVTIEEGELDRDDANLLDQLANRTPFNIQQYKVEHSSVEKNTLVEAGAGTGKTFSMVSRVAYLCNKRVNAVSNIADEIAMITFTNDAANNMKIRLKQMFVNYFVLTGDPRFLRFVEDVDRAHISTIHSFALDILRREILYTGLGTNFRIASNEYRRGQIYDSYLSDFLADKESENPNFINEIPIPIYDLKKKLIQMADRLLTKSVDLHQIKPAEMGVNVDDALPYFNELIEKVIIPAEDTYSADIHLSNDMDLKECIILLEKVLAERKGKLESLKIRYMFVDEFQDTDDVQIQVIQRLQKAINAECRLFVVGDLKQSIYRFRGANLSAFDQLTCASLYDWERHALTINYRTDYRLLEILGNVFSGMGTQNYLPYREPQDKLFGNIIKDADDNELFVEVPCNSKDEDKFIEIFVDTLLHQKAQISAIMKARYDEHKEPLSKEERTIAVLVRSNWQIDRLVREARKKGVTIETKSGGDLFQLESTLDLYKLVLALNNASNPLYLVNLIESNYTGLSLDYQKYHNVEMSNCTDDLRRILDEFFGMKMHKSWRQIIDEAYTQPILYVLKHLYDALQPWKQYSYNDADQKHYMANYEYLLEQIIKYSRVDTLTLNQIVEYLKVNILTGQQQKSRDVEMDETDISIICTTVHKSKGLEYGTVILPYTDDDITDLRKVKIDANYVDNKLSYTVLFENKENKIRQRNSNYDENMEEDEQVAEESRILYVALTRAIRNCVWIHNLDSNPEVSWGSLMED